MNIVRARSFKKDYVKLSPKIQKQFAVRIALFRENPSHPQLSNHAIHHPYTGCRSINISSDFRAIYTVQNDVVTFLYIGSHSELYK